MSRTPGLLLAAALLSACSGGSGTGKSRLSGRQDIMTLQIRYAAVRNGASGAPVNALVISGTIANKDPQPLPCRPDSFLLSDRSGNAITPSTAWCDVPAIGPNNAAAFNLTFRSLPQPPIELRFEHGDGTYEARSIAIPAQ